ncbi:MAG: mechanosensitive ion channel family protein [Paracoccaceae bacterium]
MLYRIIAFLTVVLLSLGVLADGSYAQDKTDEKTETPETSTYAKKAQDADLGIDELAIYLTPLTHDELKTTVEAWQGHVQSVLVDLGDINLKIIASGDKKDDALRDKFAETLEVLVTSTAKYESAIVAWTLKGAAPEATKPHTDYVRAATISVLGSTDAKTLLKQSVNWLTAEDGGMQVLFGILAIVAAVWALIFVARFARALARRALDRVSSISRLLKTFVTTVVFWAVFVIGLMIVLGLFGINVTPIFAVFGGLSFILGFALQDTLGNLASGLMIMILKPFDTGDFIEVSGSSGIVDDMSVVSTRIRTFDNQIIVVPNSKIWGDIITNVSASEDRRVDLVFGIGYSDDSALAIRILNDLITAHPLCIENPKPEVFVGELGESSVNIYCRPWCKNDDYWTIYWDLTGQAKIKFDESGISIPFPQRDVHLIPVQPD